MKLELLFIGFLLIVIFVLTFLIFKKGWNCTENGCVYVVGGSFDSYEKCNSKCGKNTQETNKTQISKLSPNSDLSSNSNLESNQVQAYFPPPPPLTYPPIYSGYYSYLSNPYHHDNYWHRKNSDGIQNHNNNNIFINSPTGPNGKKD